MAIVSNERDEKWRHKLSDVVPLDIPYNVQIEPSDSCNFKCEYCIYSVKNLSENKMSWSLYNKLFLI